MYTFYPKKTLSSVLLDILRYFFIIIASGFVSVAIVFTYIVSFDNLQPEDYLTIASAWFSMFVLFCILDPIQNYRSFQKKLRIEREKQIIARTQERKEQAIKWEKQKKREEANQQFIKAVENGELLQEIKRIPEGARTPLDWYNLTTILVGNTMFMNNNKPINYRFVFEGVDSLDKPTASNSLEKNECLEISDKTDNQEKE